MPKRKSRIDSRGNAILAKCADCMGYYVDGRMDCRIPTCPLYPYMPYREMEPDLTWAEEQRWKKYSPATRARMRERAKRQKHLPTQATPKSQI